jgi:muramoyltetrapeptide carboxypeptidase
VFERGVEELKRSGFDPMWDLVPTENYSSKEGGFCTASAERRAEALTSLFVNDDAKAVIAARGGFGSIELLPLLDYDALKSFSKPFVGYSDVTVLLLALWARAGIPTIHGPTVGCEFASAEDSSDAAKSVHALVSLLMDPEFRVHAPGTCIRGGAGEGPLIVGNLTMLLTLLATPWDVSYDGAVLVVEDIGEAPYRVRRALIQLKQAGKLENLSAMVFGRFSGAKPNGGLSVEEVLDSSVDDIFAETSYPIIRDVAVGHSGCNLPLPIGCRALVEPDGIQTLESPLKG